MDIKKRTIEELKILIKNDYKILLSDDEAREFGGSLLRLARLALVAVARAEEKKNINDTEA